MTNIPYYLVNSFCTDSPTSGSQCAVLLLDEQNPLFEDDTALRDISINFDYPATSFVRPKHDGEAADGVVEYDLRWFAYKELPFCGHGTLAAAHALFTLDPSTTTINFTAKPGTLTATREGDSTRLSIPSIPFTDEPTDLDKLESQLEGVSSLRRGDLINAAGFIWGDDRSLIIELKGAVNLGGAEFRGGGSGLSVLKARMIIFTQRTGEAGGRLQISSRVFVPTASPIEDPVTGSAHAALTTYYSKHPFPTSQITPPNKDQGTFEIDAKQVSKRGGGMQTRLQGDRVIITAKAREWAKGQLVI